MKKKVKARKEHECGQCERVIPAGEVCWYEEGRDPIFEYDDGSFPTQIGIEYWKSWLCLDEYSCLNRMF